MTVDAPYRFLDAFTAELAYRLARLYRPEMEQARKMDAREAWDMAANQDVENVPLYVVPAIEGYFN